MWEYTVILKNDVSQTKRVIKGSSIKEACRKARLDLKNIRVVHEERIEDYDDYNY